MSFNIAHDALMSVISDFFAVFLCLGLLILSDRNRSRKNFEDTIFYRLCLMMLFVGLSDLAAYLMIDREYSLFGYPAALLYTLEKLLIDLSILQWIFYLDYQIYKNRDHIKRRYGILYVPVLLLFALYAVNIFTGIFFYVDQRLVLCEGPGYYPLILLETLGFLYPAFEIYRYSKRNRIVWFSGAWPVVVPVLLDVVVSSLTRYSATALSFCASLAFLYFFMMNRWRFVDEETGFFNGSYLDFLKKLKREGKRDYGYILRFTTKDGKEELCRALKGEAPTESDIIREREGSFLLCTGVCDRARLRDLGEFVLAGLEEEKASFDILEFDSYKITENRTDFSGVKK